VDLPSRPAFRFCFVTDRRCAACKLVALTGEALRLVATEGRASGSPWAKRNSRYVRGALVLKIISLDQAARVLSEWWSQPAPHAITPDWAADAARKAGCAVRVDRVHDWEASSDDRSLSALTEGVAPLSGEVLLISEASFNAGAGAFQLDASDLPAVLAEHQRLFEPVFNGDVVVIELRTKRNFCMHHNGSVIHISAPPPPA
jgi:hypothetical protein